MRWLPLWLLLQSPLAAWATPSAQPRYAIVIGNNVGSVPSRRLRYAEQDAQKMYRVLTDRGGFAPQRTHLLVNHTAQQVWGALVDVDRTIRERRDRAGEKALLLIYYSGHANSDALELKHTPLSFGKLTKFVEKSAAAVRLAIVDACHSGKLATSRAARPAPANHVQATDRLASRGFAIITSSAEHELSQESEEIRGAFFTHYFVSALRGAADRSRDGRVTLAEAYTYSYARTVTRTSRSLAGPQHPMYRFRLNGQGSLVLTTLREQLPRLAVRLPGAGGRLVVMDETRNQLLAETETPATGTATLAVPSGRYRVYHLKDGRLKVARVAVAAGAATIVDSRMFQDEKLSRSVAKGGLFRPQWSHRIDAGFLLRRWPLDSGGLSYGAALQYRAEGPNGWSPTGRLTMTAAPDAQASSGYLDVGVAAGVGWRRALLPWITLRIEALAGYEHLRQSNRDQQARHSSALTYLGQLSLETPLHPLLLTTAIGAGGRAFRLRQAGWTHRFDLQWTIGAGFRLE